jgi:hypothetical protein
VITGRKQYRYPIQLFKTSEPLNQTVEVYGKAEAGSRFLDKAPMHLGKEIPGNM